MSNRLEIAHAVHGDPNAPTVILIHGVVHQQHAWDAVVPLLAEKYRVVTFDLPGHGRSPRVPGVTIEQIATDFGVHPMTLTKWMRQADIDEGAKTGKSTSDSAELRELRRRNRLLEQENEVLRRAAAYLSQANLPGKGSTRS